MSFSLKIKQELLSAKDDARHCNIAELSAILGCCGALSIRGNGITLKLHTENYYVSQKCGDLIHKIFGIRAHVSVSKHMDGRSKTGGARMYFVYIGDTSAAKKILSAAGFTAEADGGAPSLKNVSPLVVSSVCCRRAYVRGFFLASGSLINPEKSYHAEFVDDSEQIMNSLLSIVNSFSLNARMIQRKDSYVVYLKDSEQIADLLNIMQAHQALLELASVRVFKDVRNDINRRVNFEAANLNKTVSASVKQIEDINFIKEKKGLSYLNEQLGEAAALRLTHQEASLVEIGRMLTPPVSKSCINHRFRKINEIADNLRDIG